MAVGRRGTAGLLQSPPLKAAAAPPADAAATAGQEVGEWLSAAGAPLQFCGNRPVLSIGPMPGTRLS